MDIVPLNKIFFVSGEHTEPSTNELQLKMIPGRHLHPKWNRRTHVLFWFISSTCQGDVARLLADKGQSSVDHLLLDRHLEQQKWALRGERRTYFFEETLFWTKALPMTLPMTVFLERLTLYSMRHEKRKTFEGELLEKPIPEIPNFIHIFRSRGARFLSGISGVLPPAPAAPRARPCTYSWRAKSSVKLRSV